MYVVIDSMVMYSDPRLGRLHLRIVRHHARLGEFDLVVPEVVVRESVANFTRRAGEAYEAMKPARELTTARPTFARSSCGGARSNDVPTNLDTNASK